MMKQKKETFIFTFSPALDVDVEESYFFYNTELKIPYR